MSTRQAWNFKDLSGQTFGKLTVKGLQNVRDNKTYWLCACACGKDTVVAQGNLKNTNSCGCEKYRRLPEAARNAVLYTYKRGAKKRKFEWRLSDERFYGLTQQPCHYCGALPSNVKQPRLHTKYVYNGIDRKDNSLGYTEENVVPCCRVCNHAKHTMSYIEFMDYLTRLTAFRVLSRESNATA